MRTKKFLVVCAACVMGLSILVGCGNKTQPEQPEVPKEPETGAVEPTPSANKGIDAMVGVLGKTDADVVAALGAGTESKDDAGGMIAREYENYDVLGQKALVSALYNETAVVYSVSALFSDVSFADLRDALVSVYGEPSMEEQQTESGGNLAQFEAPSAVLELIDAYGSVSLQISAKA